MSNKKNSTTFFHLGTKSMMSLLFLLFFMPSSAVFSAPKSLKVDFQFSDQNGDFVSVANSTEWHSFFENKTETESEIETEIEEIESNNPKASFSPCFFIPQDYLLFLISKNLVFAKAEFITVSQPPFYQLYSHWKLHCSLI